jgi:orotate phosphoribosyltransferase
MKLLENKLCEGDVLYTNCIGNELCYHLGIVYQKGDTKFIFHNAPTNNNRFGGTVIFEKFEGADMLAGVATAGIPWGAMAADQLKLPYIYVRPKPKEHGLGNQIEGAYATTNKILVIEDLISTGKSSLQVVDVLRNAGLEVVGMVSIFNYGFQIADDAFKAAGVPFHSLTNYASLIELAVEKGEVDASTHDTLMKWRESPSTWNQ